MPLPTKTAISNILLTLALLAWWAAMTTGTHLPRVGVPIETGVDKILHFGAYFGLTFFIVWRLRRHWGNLPPGRLAVILPVIAVWGIVDEVTQQFVGRDPSVYDWLADVLGIVLATGIFLAIDRWLTVRSRGSAEVVE